MGLLKRLLWGETDEVRDARRRMVADRGDPRRLFVWGIVSVSYEVDPGYLPEHSGMAIRDWYGVESADDLLSRTTDDLAGNDVSVAYDQYRMCFLARAGHAAGLIDESTSWAMAFRHASAIQPHCLDWKDYGDGYLAGHLAFRTTQGDPPELIAQYRNSITARLARLERRVWSAIPYATRLV